MNNVNSISPIYILGLVFNKVKNHLLFSHLSSSFITIRIHIIWRNNTKRSFHIVKTHCLTCVNNVSLSLCTVCSLNIVFFFFKKNKYFRPLLRQHSTAIHSTENSQPIRLTVHKDLLRYTSCFGCSSTCRDRF